LFKIINLQIDVDQHYFYILFLLQPTTLHFLNLYCTIT